MMGRPTRETHETSSLCHGWRGSGIGHAAPDQHRHGALALRFNSSNDLRTFLATGILGGYTTFSAFSLDFVALMGRQEHAAAAFYVIGSVVLALLAVYAGLWLTRALLA